MATDALRAGTPYSAIVGRVLAVHRDQKGREQNEIARAVGVAQSSWSRIERGDSVINVEQLHVAAKALGTSAQEILKEADKAAYKLSQRDVMVQTAKNKKSERGMIALIGVAALTALIVAMISEE